MLRLVLLSISFVLIGSLYSQSAYELKIDSLRTNKDKRYADTTYSPLHKDSIASFTGLKYYKAAEAYNVTAKFKKKLGKPFKMTTSSGKVKEFRTYGYAKFKLNGKRFKLPVYQNLKLMKNPMYRDYLFIPFTDLTNAHETYAAGRYIEGKTPEGKTINLDFNQCFNPYCHYRTGFNCPIPPLENHLNTRIEAGEKLLYTDH